MQKSPENGYSPITLFKVYKKIGVSGSFNEETPTTLNSTTATISGLTETETYEFKVTASNVHDESPDSNIVQLVYANVPAQMDPVTFSKSATQVTITWTDATPRGSSVIAYSLLLQNGNTGIYSANSSLCDTSNLSTRSCNIDMSDFSTLGYLPGQTLHAKVTAENGIGVSEPSLANTGPIVYETVPNAPENIILSSVDEATVEVNWDPINTPAQSGYSAITDYIIEVYSNDASIRNVTTLNSTSYQIDNLITGTEYIFVVRYVYIHLLIIEQSMTMELALLLIVQ
jgi:hypothetical protein